MNKQQRRELLHDAMRTPPAYEFTEQEKTFCEKNGINMQHLLSNSKDIKSVIFAYLPLVERNYLRKTILRRLRDSGFNPAVVIFAPYENE